jgi:hypothetical protein
MGLAYMPSGKASFALELEKDVDFPLRLKGGVEYRPVEPLFLRAGFGNNPSMVHFGIGLAIGTALNVDLASSYHQTLGLSPSASVSYEKPNRK